MRLVWRVLALKDRERIMEHIAKGMAGSIGAPYF